MKKQLTRWLATAALLALPAAALADGAVESTTMLRIYQDNRTGYQAKTFAPLIQFLGGDLEKLADGNLSAHFFGWGRIDTAEHYVTPDQGQQALNGSLGYGYLQYRFGAANAQARAGRFFVREGILNEQVDGVSLKTDLPYGFGVSAFGGANVHTVDIPGENNDGKGDGIVGGRVNYRFGGLFELGLSGVYESAAPALSDPALAGRLGNHRLVGGDLWFSPFRMLSVSGRSSYNTETSSFAEHGYLVQLKPVKGLTVAGEFNEYRDRAYFYASPFFARLPSMLDGGNLNQLSRVYGGSASYQLGEKLEIAGDFKHYRRDLGQADRSGGEVRVTLPNGALRAGAGYHYLNAGPDFAIIPAASTSASLHELRAWAMRDTASYFTSVDFIEYLFKREIAGKKSAFELLGSLGWHLSPSLALSGDLSYGSNPNYDDEFKGLVRLSYAAKFSAKGDTK